MANTGFSVANSPPLKQLRRERNDMFTITIILCFIPYTIPYSIRTVHIFVRVRVRVMLDISLRPGGIAVTAMSQLEQV